MGGVEAERSIVQDVEIWWWILDAPQEENVIHFPVVHEREQFQRE